MGGGYATGRSAAEVRALIETIDWDATFRGEVAYPLKAFRRKEERREFPLGLELRVRDGSDRSGYTTQLWMHTVVHGSATPTHWPCLGEASRRAGAVRLLGGSDGSEAVGGSASHASSPAHMAASSQQAAAPPLRSEAVGCISLLVFAYCHLAPPST